MPDASHRDEGPRPTAPAATGDPEPGERIDHYTVLGVIGRGALGVVVRARDTVLGREVALKLLPAAGGRGHARGLMRQAQAMARLSHPHVVAVHGVGETPAGVYIAMELFVGGPATRWLAAAPGWRAVVEAFVDAADGLAAAHDAGLVHGDFKPDNVLRRDDGTVVVSDFGLAAATGDADTSRERIDPASAPAVAKSRLMAPERLRGEPTDARADQFAFGVSLYRGLYGRDPFVGDTVAALLQAVDVGQLQSPARGTDVPRSLLGVVSRCLQIDPAKRYPDMRAVARALDTVLSARGRWLRGGLIAGVASASIVAGVGLWGGVRGRSCRGVGAAIDDTWGAVQRDDVREAMLAVERGFVDRTAQVVVSSFDDYADAWAEARVAACHQAEAEASAGSEASAQTLGRIRCLESRRRHLGAAVAVLSASPLPTEVVGEALAMARGLPPIPRCSSAEYLSSEVPPPEDAAVARAVESLEREIAELEAMVASGRVQGAVERGQEVVAAAKRLAYAPVLVKALNARGFAYAQAGDDRRALVQLREAYVVADVASPNDVGENLLRTGTVLARQGKTAEALLQYRRAEAVYAKLGVSPPRLVAGLARALAQQGEYDEALRLLVAARERIEANGGRDDPDLPAVLQSTVEVHQARGHHGLAAKTAAEALARLTERNGPEHPAVANLLVTMARIAIRRRALGESRELLRRAQRILNDAYGPASPRLNALRSTRAEAQLVAGEAEAALAGFREVVRRIRQARGDAHPGLAAAYAGAGRALLALGRFDEARIELRRSGETFIAAGHPDHVDRWAVDADLAAAHGAQGDLAKARATTLGAIERARAASGSGFFGIGQLRAQLGRLSLQEGRCGRAVDELRVARAELSANVGADTVAVAQVDTDIGVALQLLGRPVEAARAYRDAARTFQRSAVATVAAMRSADALAATAELSQGNAEAAASIVATLQAAVAGDEGPADPASVAAVEAAAAIVEARGLPLTAAARERVSGAMERLGGDERLRWTLVVGAAADAKHCTRR